MSFGVLRFGNGIKGHHVHVVQAEGLEWWIDNFQCYGSLVLGKKPLFPMVTKGRTRATFYGIYKCLSVHKYMKIVTGQRSTRVGSKRVPEAEARIFHPEDIE
jgi:sulfopropanediol 3-dehydrogenase